MRIGGLAKVKRLDSFSNHFFGDHQAGVQERGEGWERSHQGWAVPQGPGQVQVG